MIEIQSNLDEQFGHLPKVEPFREGLFFRGIQSSKGIEGYTLIQRFIQVAYPVDLDSNHSTVLEHINPLCFICNDVHQSADTKDRTRRVIFQIELATFEITSIRLDILSNHLEAWKFDEILHEDGEVQCVKNRFRHDPIVLDRTPTLDLT
jgi:hypothetical protein